MEVGTGLQLNVLTCAILSLLFLCAVALGGLIGFMSNRNDVPKVTYGEDADEDADVDVEEEDDNE